MVDETDDRMIDWDRFEQARKELGPGFGRILGYYREDGARAVQAIEQAARERAAPPMVRPAHTLKGDSLMFGAERIGFAAERIEKAARRGVEDRAFPDDVVPLVRDLRALFEATTALFDKAMPSVAPTPVSVVPKRTSGFGRKAIG